ncbi:MAG: hypothetical protein F4060_16690 [Holophagales bacterium]|nr:hypothetical protein [Holophagales bacterium]MYI81563.1 hypothetical protein [Holophagales bacterium]
MNGVLTKFLNDAQPVRAAVLGAVTLLLGSSAVYAADSAPVLGTSGDVYQVATGTYGDLFPDGNETSASAAVLRLEARRGSGTVENYLVPGSESDDSDRTPSLFFDGATERLYVVWSSSNASTLTRINLASFDGSEWSETIEVSGNIYSEKSAPRLAVTHDRFELAEATAGGSSMRTVLHVVWSEDTTDGEKVMYAPVVLIDGALASTWRRVHLLNDYVSQALADDPFSGDVAAKLLSAPTVDAGSEPNAVVIGFADSATGALVQLELSTPATELSELADSLADHLESSNLCEQLDNDDANALTSVAEAARVHIVLVGRRIRSRVLSPLAADVKDVLVQRAATLCAEGGLTSVSSAARVHIVLVGAKAQEGDLLEGAAGSDGHVLLAAAQEIGDDYVQHLARLQVKSERIAPTIGDGEPTILVSPNGTGAIVVWENGNTLTYVETDTDAAGDWSSSHTLQIGSSLSRSEAYSMLRDRARSLE